MLNLIKLAFSGMQKHDYWTYICFKGHLQSYFHYHVFKSTACAYGQLMKFIQLVAITIIISVVTLET